MAIHVCPYGLWSRYLNIFELPSSVAEAKPSPIQWCLASAMQVRNDISPLESLFITGKGRQCWTA
ncbi:MAG TPA: hypothetical protein ACFYD3_09285 [Candidatus Hypogeohydataceae bacterium YC41]